MDPALPVNHWRQLSGAENQTNRDIYMGRRLWLKIMGHDFVKHISLFWTTRAKQLNSQMLVELAGLQRTLLSSCQKFRFSVTF